MKDNNIFKNLLYVQNMATLFQTLYALTINKINVTTSFINKNNIHNIFVLKITYRNKFCDKQEDSLESDNKEHLLTNNS